MREWTERIALLIPDHRILNSKGFQRKFGNRPITLPGAVRLGIRSLTIEWKHAAKLHSFAYCTDFDGAVQFGDAVSRAPGSPEIHSNRLKKKESKQSNLPASAAYNPNRGNTNRSSSSEAAK